jgi:iron(II)-dependent oxidoreductase
LQRSQIVRAVRQLDGAMALVPAGNVLVGAAAEQVALAHRMAENVSQEIQYHTIEPVYLDRHAVTNEQYARFVAAGGYEQLALWAEESLPALFDFLDQTGEPGPRFWSNGQFPEGSDRLPVVGVSWYEACAYARWVGKRLPTDAEWTKAGAWPVESAPGRILQRRYPWGESFDLRRANFWGSGRNGPVAVDEYSNGTSVNGISQLIGNVWEWTGDSLQHSVDAKMHVPDSMRSIRGGAYNTYFENQATCHYLSGENPLARKPNVGFRLALSMSILATSGNVEGDDTEQHSEPDVESAENKSSEELIVS